MNVRFFVTAAGLAAGWVSMHNGGFAVNPASRYLPFGAYKPATMADLDAAADAGYLRKEFGEWVAVGGILRNWKPAAA